MKWLVFLDPEIFEYTPLQWRSLIRSRKSVKRIRNLSN